MVEMNYVVGRGRLYFDKFPNSTTYVGTGERYLGDTSALSLAQAVTDLKHYSSEHGLKVMDRSVTLQRDNTGQFTCDHIDVDNLAAWLAGEASAYSQAAAPGVVESLTVQPGLWYQVGVTVSNPLGVSDLTALTATATVAVAATGTLTFAGQPTAADTITINGVAITFVASGAVGNQVNIGGNAAGTAQALRAFINANGGTLLVSATGDAAVLTLAALTPGTGGNAITLAKSGTYPTLSGATLAGGSAGSSVALTDLDWTIELDTGRFQILDTGGITPNSVVTVTYTQIAVAAHTIAATGVEIFGKLRFVADNPEGRNTDYLWPYVRLSPNGDFQLKGDDWQRLTFSFEALKLSTQERVYARQRD